MTNKSEEDELERRVSATERQLEKTPTKREMLRAFAISVGVMECSLQLPLSLSLVDPVRNPHAARPLKRYNDIRSAMDLVRILLPPLGYVSGIVHAS